MLIHIFLVPVPVLSSSLIYLGKARCRPTLHLCWCEIRKLCHPHICELRLPCSRRTTRPLNSEHLDTDQFLAPVTRLVLRWQGRQGKRSSGLYLDEWGKAYSQPVLLCLPFWVHHGEFTVSGRYGFLSSNTEKQQWEGGSKNRRIRVRSAVALQVPWARCVSEERDCGRSANYFPWNYLLVPDLRKYPLWRLLLWNSDS